MKVVVAGSRTIANYELVCSTIERSKFEITEVVSGGALGVDQLGERWARERGISMRRFAVTATDWRRDGKSAGHRRNREMAAYADALILIWDGTSKGSGGMLREARLCQLKIFAPCFRCHGSGCGSMDTPLEVASRGDVWPCAMCEGTGDFNLLEDRLRDRMMREF